MLHVEGRMFGEDLVQELRLLGVTSAIDANERFAASVVVDKPAWMSAVIIAASSTTVSEGSYTEALLQALSRWDAMPEALHDWREKYQDLGALEPLLTLSSAPVLESLRGGARMQWRVRELVELWTSVRPGRTPRDTEGVNAIGMSSSVPADFGTQERRGTDLGIGALGIDVDRVDGDRVDGDRVDGERPTQLMEQETRRANEGSPSEVAAAELSGNRPEPSSEEGASKRPAPFAKMKGAALIAAAEHAVDQGRSMQAAEALWQWLSDEDLETEHVLSSPTALFEAVELVAPAPGLHLALLRLRTQRALVGELAYPVWRALVHALQEGGSGEVELNMAVEMALTWGNEAGVPEEELADLHELALLGKTQAGRWASAAWHAVQLPAEESESVDPEVWSKRVRRLLADADDVSVLEQLKPAVMKAEDHKLLFAFAQAAMRFSRWDVGEEALSRLMGELSDEASDKLRKRLIADLATVYEQKASSGGDE